MSTTTETADTGAGATCGQLSPEQMRHSNYKAANWFALHCLSGQEDKVRESFRRRMKIEEIEDVIHEIIVPTQRVTEVKKGKKTETDRKLYPGYVFVLANLLDDANKIIERTWYALRDTPGVIGFANGQNPIPMRQSEVDAMLAQMSAGEERAVPKTAFAVGDKVKVGDGPFQNQDGVVEEVFPDRGRLMVSVNIFGRSTGVELEYWQVEKSQ